MLEIGTAMYLLMSGVAKERVLYAGKVLVTAPTEFTAEFEQPTDLPPGTDYIALGDTNGRFFQQGVKVLATLQAEPKLIVSFARNGDVTSAEQRQMFRVSVVTAGIEARIDKERKCQVVDLSFEGFGAIAKSEYRIGTFVQVIVTHEGKPSFEARARVQTVKARPDGTFRYGLLVPDSKSPARKTMQQLAGQFQRLQLRRLSGAA